MSARLPSVAQLDLLLQLRHHYPSALRTFRRESVAAALVRRGWGQRGYDGLGHAYVSLTPSGKTAADAVASAIRASGVQLELRRPLLPTHRRLIRRALNL